MTAFLISNVMSSWRTKDLTILWRHAQVSVPFYFIRINRAWFRNRVAKNEISRSAANRAQMHIQAEHNVLKACAHMRNHAYYWPKAGTGSRPSDPLGPTPYPFMPRQMASATNEYWFSRLRKQIDNHLFTLRSHDKAALHEGYNCLRRLERSKKDLQSKRESDMVALNGEPAEHVASKLWHEIDEWALLLAAKLFCFCCILGSGAWI